MTRLWAGGPTNLGSIPSRERDFIFSTTHTPILGPTEPIQWIPWVSSSGVKRPGHKIHHSCTYSADVKNAWSYTSTPSYVFMTWYLIKHRDDSFVLNK
jgi:hypothetical protein